MSGLASFVIFMYGLIGSLVLSILSFAFSLFVSNYNKAICYKLGSFLLILTALYGIMAYSLEKHWVSGHFVDNWCWVIFTGIIFFATLIVTAIPKIIS